MTNTPKSNTDIYKFLTTSLPEHLVEFIKEDDGQTIAIESFRKAEQLHLHIINQQAEEIEKLRMQLVACGVGALSNTVSAIASQRIASDNPYYSASLSDVYRAVDREIALREENERLDQLRHKYFELQDKIVPQLNEEIEKLKGQGITTLNDYREEVKMRLEAQTERDALQSRFDGLLKELEDAVIPMANIEETGGAGGYYLEYEKFQSIIKQARGENGTHTS